MEYHKFMESGIQSSNAAASRFNEAFGTPNREATKTGELKVLSDAFMGTLPLHTPRSLWASLRRAWYELNEDDTLCVLIAACPMTQELGLAPYWLVPNTSRMVCQTESLDLTLRGADKNTTLFSVHPGPEIKRTIRRLLQPELPIGTMVKEADTVIRYFHQHEVRLSEALDDFE